MTQFLEILAILAIWLLVTQFILPKLGVPT